MSEAPTGIETPAFFELPELALSVRQPWPWAMQHAGKDIENRNWRTSRRGRIAVHAGKGMSLAEYRDCLDLVRQIGGDKFDLPGMDELSRGGIVGSVEIVDCVTRSDSPWFFGTFGFVLRNFRPAEFIACRGQLGFFKWRAGL